MRLLGTARIGFRRLACLRQCSEEQALYDSFSRKAG
jgi:hypothetical protein